MQKLKRQEKILKDDLIVEQVQSWLEQVVIGLNLCPFAAKPNRNDQIKISISHATTEERLLEDILSQLNLLHRTTADELETTLVVVPDMLSDFFDYNLFLDWVDALIKQQGWEGIYQVATFHPDYCFGGANPEDDENLTNRSPFPILHLIREESMERVLKHYPSPEQIPDNNIARVESLSEQEKKSLFPYLFSTIPFKGLLFDLDGTLVDSLQSVDRCWRAWAKKMELDPDYVMSVIHGRPARESQAELAPNLSQQELNEEIAWLENAEATDTKGVVALDGSIEFLNKLNDHSIPWAIVTSGTFSVASARIKAARLPYPKVLITADRVTNGKPNPEPFLIGAKEIAVDPEDCIVFEDAPAGVRAGVAAGSTVVAILSHSNADDLPDANYHIASLAKADICCLETQANENDGLFELIV